MFGIGELMEVFDILLVGSCVCLGGLWIVVSYLEEELEIGDGVLWLLVWLKGDGVSFI